MDESRNPYESPTNEHRRFEHEEGVESYVYAGFVLLATLLAGIVIGAVGVLVLLYLRSLYIDGSH